MKFKSIACPEPDKGISFEGQVSELIPDQSLSLQEILERFTRGESLPVQHDARFDPDGDEDLEKIQRMDLVDRQEYMDNLKKTQNDYEKQERKKAESAREEARKKIEEEERQKLAASKAQKKSKDEPE
nr:MAG: hypothetical protein [Microvirus sp.]